MTIGWGKDSYITKYKFSIVNISFHQSRNQLFCPKTKIHFDFPKRLSKLICQGTCVNGSLMVEERITCRIKLVNANTIEERQGMDDQLQIVAATELA